MSKIEWTGDTWNVIIGCSKISPGCTNCYAIDQAYRNWEMARALPEENRGRLAYYDGLTKIAHDKKRQWTGKVVFVPEALEIPLKRKKPQIYFVNSMSDLFHERVKNEWIDEIFKVMEQTPQHTYQILTKRPDRMLDYILSTYQTYQGVSTPVRNIWLGSSIEHQDCLDDRIPALTKLNKRGWTTFYSCEPLLESVDLHIPEYPVSWVIAGGESGHGARPCHYEWLLNVVEQCQVTNTPVFVKQLGSNYWQEGTRIKVAKKGGDFESLPSKLQIRQFPI
jgi:protein gp37